jgi:SNF2 family DNA or RNA helicase
VQALAGIDILRKLCNHPDLLERSTMQGTADYGNPERWARPVTRQHSLVVLPLAGGVMVSCLTPGCGSALICPCLPLQAPLCLCLPCRSGKLSLVVKLLAHWKAGGHKALVFTQARLTRANHTAPPHRLVQACCP